MRLSAHYAVLKLLRLLHIKISGAAKFGLILDVGLDFL